MSVALGKQKAWRLKDIEFIRLMYPIAKVRTIAVELDTTVHSVYQAAKRFGIRKYKIKKAWCLSQKQN